MLQTAVGNTLERRLGECVLRSSGMKLAVEDVFGTPTFELTPGSARVLLAAGGLPGIPHVDDLSAEELFCVVHLRDGQKATMGVPIKAIDYDGW
jgi:hypothetical protein